jgi:predicted nucleic acid-binding Zn ribbon protein
MSKPQALGNVLQQLIDRLGYRERIDAVRAVETWAEMAGPRINGVTDRVWVHERKLIVQVRSATWRQQLHLQRSAWCERLNTELGGRVIDEVVFR